MKIAFVTFDHFPDLYEDDQRIAAYLSMQGILVVPAVWDDASVDWQEFDAIVLRSMWDYFEKPVAFDQWLDRLQRLNCVVLNPLSVVKWNQNKRYFDDFAQKGVLLPPYVICASDFAGSLKGILVENNWEKVVVKPAISGGAFQTWVVHLDSVDGDELRFAALLQSGEVIVQVFVEEILTRGELSLIYFGKKFSHAICKKPGQGDFRVQTQHGGTADIFVPEPSLLAYADSLLHSIPEPLLYARVDVVVADSGAILLMELELIEPSLSVYLHDPACDLFYTALMELVGDL